jgi:hypothetical protein
MPSQSVIRGSLAVATGSVTSFVVSWDKDTDSLSVNGNNNATFTDISRLDFLNPDTGAALAVIPCVAAGSSFKLSGGDLCDFTLSLNSLLGGPSPLTFKGNLCSQRGQLFFSAGGSGSGQFPNGTRDLTIGGVTVLPISEDETDADTGYISVLAGLSATGNQNAPPHADWVDFPSIKLADQTAATRFGTQFGREFNSQNITCHVRTIELPGGFSVPVLTIRRQLCLLSNEESPFHLPPPFAISIPADKTGSGVHAAQFPSAKWLITVPASGEPQQEVTDWHVELSGFSGKSINAFWSESVVSAYLGGLASVNDVLPISVLPSLQLAPTNDDNPDFFWRLCASFPSGIPNGPFTLRLVPGGMLDPEVIPGVQPPSSVTLDCFRTHTGDGLPLTAMIGLTTNPEGADPVTGVGQPVTGDDWYAIRFPGQDTCEIDFTLQVQSFGEEVLRLGALDLSFGAPVPAATPVVVSQLECIITFSAMKLSQQFLLGMKAGNAWFPQVYITGTLPAFRYSPAGEDALPQTASDAILDDDLPNPTSDFNIATAANFRRDAAIVLDLSSNEANAQKLTLLESSRTNSNAPHSQQLIFRLNAADTGSFGPVMVLDRQQFLVARVQLNAANANTTGEEIGVWCNLFPEGPGWRISSGATGFVLQLPPQTIGEEMERIVDPTDLLDDKTVNYRYSPAFKANLLASYNPQNYVQPAWDLRSVLGYAQQRAPGAGVDPKQGVSFELLHGIGTTVAAPNLRLSEMFARLGDFPGPMPTNSELLRIHPEFTSDQQNAVMAMAQNWSLHYRQLLSRPAVLELWDADQGPDLLLDAGVACTVRAKALYDPTPDPNFPAGVVTPLKAGVGFALESPDLITELKNHLGSTSAHLARPRFSALGGWGDQKASFANGKIIVESHTAMGRLSSLSVTLVGRIGVCWNRALHVTVYERTVLPSRQFYLEQEQLNGRPILRKVREYVQIMEPVRAYPEAGSSPVTRGFVSGSSFKSTTINVDSTWGGDVGSSGWQVPLWRPDAAPSDIYPRPHINFTVEVDPTVGVDTMLAEILDPQKLCFYTDTSDDTTSDTDTWAATAEIDYTDARPVRTIDKTDEAPWKVPNGPDPSVEPGFGRFTYHVARIPGQTNLVAERTANAIGAALNNVSMMRGNPVAPPPTLAANDPRIPIQAAGRVGDWWTGMVHQLGQVPLNAADAKAQIQKLLTTNPTAPNGFIDQLQSDLNTLAAKTLENPTGTGSIPDPCGTVANQLLRGVSKLDASAQTALTQILTQFSNDLKTRLNALAQDATQTAAQLEQTVNDIFTSIDTTLAPFTGNLNAGADTLNRICASFQTKLTNAVANLVITNTDLLADVQAFQNQIDIYRNTMTGVCRIVVGNAGNKLTAEIPLTLPSNLATLASQLLAGSTDVADALTAIQAQIATLQTAVSSMVIPCQAAATALTQAETQLEGDLEATRVAIIALIASAPADLQKALNDFYQSFKIKILSDNANDQAQQITTWVNALLANATTQATTLCRAFALPLTSIATDLINQLQGEIQNALTDLVGDATAFGNALESIEAEVASQLENLGSQVIGSLPALPVPSFILPGASLRLLRAFGDAPVVPTLTFPALPSLAYFYNETDLPVLMTAVTTEIGQVAQGLPNLSQFGLSMPSIGLLDRVLPTDLTSFNISDIFPKFAGLDLSGLFTGVTLPDAANQNIHVSHQIDRQTLRATLDADIDIPLAGTSTIFDIGPVCLNLVDADLQAHVQVSAGVGQQTTQTSNGSIHGQWELRIGGMVLITFVDTTLSFDESGSIHFSIKPENVQLAAVLQFITDFLTALDFGDSGFTINILPDPKVQCILDLPLPDMGGGTFAIMNLSLGALFEIGVDSDGFYVTVGANLGRQVAPFDLTIFILGGGGWFETAVTYRFGKPLTGSVSIGMAASAALELSLGPISGSVAIYFGIFANLQIGNGGGLQLGIMILVTGQVSLLGIIDVNIALLLEAEYSSGGGLTGRGSVSMSIKICWCFTLSINESVEYTFGASASTKTAPATQHIAALAAVSATVAAPPPFYQTYHDAAVNYVTMLA